MIIQQIVTILNMKHNQQMIKQLNDEQYNNIKIIYQLLYNNHGEGNYKNQEDQVQAIVNPLRAWECQLVGLGTTVNLEQEKIIEQEKVTNVNQDGEQNEISYEVKQVRMDGTILEGLFINDKLNGQGRIKYNNGQIDQGLFTNNKLSGEGRRIQSDGTKHEGIFMDGNLNGQGKIQRADVIIQGLFVNNTLNGEGEIIQSNGTILQGTFKDGQLNGQGKINQGNGLKKSGIFVKNKLNGEGQIQFNNITLKGYFKDDKLDGPGKQTELIKRINFILLFIISEGDFKGGKLNGQGRRISSTEQQNEDGEFIADMQIDWSDHLASRQCEEGQFREGTMNGQGTLRLMNGQIFVDMFKDGKLFKKTMKGINKMIIKIIRPQ